jgi:hypothetical protein
MAVVDRGFAWPLCGRESGVAVVDESGIAVVDGLGVGFICGDEGPWGGPERI